MKPTKAKIKKALDGDDALLYEMYPGLAPRRSLSERFDELLKIYWNPKLTKIFNISAVLWNKYERK